jgi:hypothetical protein
MLTITPEFYPSNAPSFWKIYQGDDLVAVVRPPIPPTARALGLCDLLPSGRPGGITYRVDCRQADDELRAAVAQLLPEQPVTYFPDSTWVWRDI